MSNRDTPHSTRKFTQYCVITYMGKEPGKELTYVYVLLLYLAVCLKFIQVDKSTIFQYNVKNKPTPKKKKKKKKLR